MTADDSLIKAVIEPDIEYVQALLKSGVDVNCRDENQATPIMWAAWLGNVSIVKLLLTYEADTTLLNWVGQTALSLTEDGYLESHVEIKQLLTKEKEYVS